jgi:hypothetical protein
MNGVVLMEEAQSYSRPPAQVFDRLTVSVFKEHREQLDEQAAALGVPVSVVVRMALERHFGKKPKTLRVVRARRRRETRLA